VTLRQLQYFVAVVDLGSFTKAAKELHVAQPSLSKQLATLEAELGGPLLERLHPSVRLTPSGRSFLPEARAATLAAERALRAARMTHDLESGEIEVASVPSIAIGLLPRSIQVLRGRRPGVVVHLHEYLHSRDMEDDVRNGVADLAVGPRPSRWTGPIRSLGWEELVVLLPSGDPDLEGDGPLELRDLATRRWVLPVPTAGLASVVAGACFDAGFEPQAAVHSSQVEALARIAAAGMGPTILPSTVIPPDLLPLARPLRRPVVRELTAYARGSWSPLATAFTETLPDVDSAPLPANAYDASA
jgi:DNA-binding transcriptional LysR family regulator